MKNTTIECFEIYIKPIDCKRYRSVIHMGNSSCMAAYTAHQCPLYIRGVARIGGQIGLGYPVVRPVKESVCTSVL